MKKPTVLNYIKDQPRALIETFNNRAEFVDPFVKIFKENNIKKIIFLGSGTSYNASQIAMYYFKHICNIDAKCYYPTVFKNYEKADWCGNAKNSEILVVGISQSGTSISTIEAIKKAKIDGNITVVLTENLKSEITEYTDHLIHLLCGKEFTPPETRGYTVTLLQLFLWAIEIAKVYKIISNNQYNEFIGETETMCNKFEVVINESEEWFDHNAYTIINSDRIYILGYGIDYGSALEAMLKIGEMLRLPSIGYEIEEYSHGPTMAITPKQTIFMIGSDEEEWNRCVNFKNVFRKYTDRVHIITSNYIEKDDRDLIFSLKVNKYLSPIMYTVPFQFVAAKGAKLIGIDTSINPFKEELAHLSD